MAGEKSNVSFYLRAVLYLQADPFSDVEDLPQARGTPKMCPNPHKSKLLSYPPLSYSTGGRKAMCWHPEFQASSG